MLKRNTTANRPRTLRCLAKKQFVNIDPYSGRKPKFWVNVRVRCSLPRNHKGKHKAEEGNKDWKLKLIWK